MSTAISLGQGMETLSTSESNHSRFDQLVAGYAKDLFRYAYWLTKDRSVSDDLVQDTLLRAWKSIDKLQNPKAVKGWLITILRRENARRFERYQPHMSEMPVEEINAKKQEYDTSTEAFVLRQALNQLPAEYSEPLILQVLHGFSQQDIADKLGITGAGAGTRLFRARRKLREILEQA